jgi:hypothetical protein
VRPSLTLVFFVSFVVSCLFFVAFVVSSAVFSVCLSCILHHILNLTPLLIMHKPVILSLHLLLASFGALECCVSKGMRRFKYKPGSHYSCRINCQHPAYQDIMISLTESRGDASLKSCMLCTAHGSRIPLLITGKTGLN